MVMQVIYFIDKMNQKKQMKNVRNPFCLLCYDAVNCQFDGMFLCSLHRDIDLKWINPSSCSFEFSGYDFFFLSLATLVQFYFDGIVVM